MNNAFKYNILWGILLVLFQAGTLAAQRTPAKEISITSAILKKKVSLQVQLPTGYRTSKIKYAVLYVLNGDDKLLDEMATKAQELHQDNDIPGMIVVGIDTGDDAAQFLSWMEKELIPALAKKYRTNGTRILLSKDLSGSLALYALLAKPALFNGYISATQHWVKNGKDIYTGMAEEAFQKPALYEGKKIFFARLSGAYDDSDPKMNEKEMQQFSDLLISKSGNRISTQYQVFSDWGDQIRPDFKVCLLFVAGSEKQPKNPTSKLEKHQLADGKWVIRDSQKKVLYDIFPYDNGPDYPSDGLFRIVKDGKIGYADEHTYAIVIPAQFDCAYPFEHGKAKVSNQCQTVKDGEYSIWESDAWKYVDKKGKY